MLSENHVGEYRAQYMVRTWSHSSMVSLPMSAESREGALSAKVESESQGGLRAADVLQGLVGRGRQNEDGVPRGRREVPVVVP